MTFLVATKPGLPPSRAIPRFIASLEVMYLTLESLPCVLMRVVDISTDDGGDRGVARRPTQNMESRRTVPREGAEARRGSGGDIRRHGGTRCDKAVGTVRGDQRAASGKQSAVGGQETRDVRRET